LILIQVKKKVKFNS